MHDYMDVGGRVPKVGAPGDAGAVTERVGARGSIKRPAICPFFRVLPWSISKFSDQHPYPAAFINFRLGPRLHGDDEIG
jgi:hypothetical protein